jgi:hypothetical protein
VIVRALNTEDHQHPDRDEHRHRHLAGEGGAGQQRFIGVDAEGDHAEVAIAAHHRHEHIGDLAVGGEVLADQRVVGPALQIGGQFQPPAEQLLTVGGAAPVAHRNAEVNDAVGIGEDDVAQAAARLPEALRHRGEFAVVAFRHQRCDVGGEQQAEIAGIAGVAHARVPLDAVEGEEGDARHQQAHHQGGDCQQLGLKAEFSPPAGQALAPVAAAGRGGAGCGIGAGHRRRT